MAKRLLYSELEAAHKHLQETYGLLVDELKQDKEHLDQARKDVQNLEQLNEKKTKELIVNAEGLKVFIRGFNEVSGSVPVDCLSDVLDEINDAVTLHDRVATSAKKLKEEKLSFLDWASKRYRVPAESFERLQKAIDDRDIRDSHTLSASHQDVLEARAELQAVKEAAATLLGSFAPKGGMV